MPFELSFSRDKNNLFTVWLNVSTLIYSICNTLTISLSAIKRDFCPFISSAALQKVVVNPQLPALPCKNVMTTMK